MPRLGEWGMGVFYFCPFGILGIVFDVWCDLRPPKSLCVLCSILKTPPCPAVSMPIQSCITFSLKSTGMKILSLCCRFSIFDQKQRYYTLMGPLEVIHPVPNIRVLLLICLDSGEQILDLLSCCQISLLIIASAD